VELTEAGQAVATELVRRHRLLELFLTQSMPMDVLAISLASP